MARTDNPLPREGAIPTYVHATQTINFRLVIGLVGAALALPPQPNLGYMAAERRTTGCNDRGPVFSNQLKLSDPKTRAARRAILTIRGPRWTTWAARPHSMLWQSWARTMRYSTPLPATCRSSARATRGDADAIYAELTGNLMTNGRLVPTGIVAVGRAQERGCSLAQSG